MLTSRRFVLVTMGILNSVFAWGQVISSPSPSSTATSQNQAAFMVSGSVVNAVTGEPVRRAVVRLNGTSNAAVFTDASGQFQFANIPEGTGWINAEKPGFFAESGLPSGILGFQRNLSISIGPNSKDIQIKLTPEARIEGRVTDSDGEPLEGIQVQALGERIVQGRKQFVQYMMASTTGTGHYLIADLAPGTYFVHTQLQPVFGNQRFGQAAGRSYPLAYPARYFPDSPDLASAQPQQLKGGDVAEADFTLAPKHTFQVSGTVAGAQNYVGVSLGEPGGLQSAHSRFDRRTNRFAVSLLPPGAWTLDFFSRDSQGNQYSAAEEVTITDFDVNGLQVALQPDSSIPVNIQQQTAGTAPGNAQVRLVSTGMETHNRWHVAVPQKGGSPGAMLIRNVPAGTYRVDAQAYNSACIGSVTSGSTDLLRENLVVTGGAPPAPIDVVLRSDCGKLLGVVHSSAGAAPASVLIVSDAAQSNPIVIQTSPDGTFSGNLVTPGSYHVYAFSSLANLEYANPEALRGYSGQQVSVEPNQPVALNLNLIERKE